MESSLSVLGGMNTEGRKIAVLGDMLELGDMSEKLHAMIADYVTANADVAFLYGKEMAACEKALTANGFEVYHSENREELVDKIRGYLRKGDTILFKGSRGMKMEKFYEALTGQELEKW